MIRRIYATFDCKAAVYHPPFLALTTAEASRMFVHGVKDSPMRDDLSLYNLGEFDDGQGTINAALQPQFIGSYVSLTATQKGELNAEK